MKFYATSRLSENILTTPEGYLICVGVPIARTGEMEYGPGETPIALGEDGKVRVTRDAAEVFRPETIRSFEGKPLTLMHPKEGDETLVTPETWKKLAVGIMQNIRRGTGETENDLVADLLVTDSEAIRLVKEGLREVSCGYEADYYELGIGRGEQKSIIGNHLALVPQGRAGSSYAINDHKGKGTTMKFSEILEALKGKKFQKQDVEALRAVANDSAIEEPQAQPPTSGPSYDSLCKQMDEMMTMVKGMAPKTTDASTQPSEGTPAKVDAVDEGGAESGLEGRMKKLEDAVAQILSKMSATGDEDVEMEETSDADDDSESEEEVTDAEEGQEDKDKEKKGKKPVGDAIFEEGDEDEDDDDTLSRAEILAPGIKPEQKNLKAKALKVAYATTDGKAAIDMFTGGKAPDLKNEKFVDAVFVGVSEILKAKRTSDLSKTKVFDFKPNLGQPEGAMTPEKLNELNAKHYGAKQ